MLADAGLLDSCQALWLGCAVRGVRGEIEWMVFDLKRKCAALERRGVDSI